MKWIEIKVIYNSNQIQVAGDLISNIFLEMGLQGVVMEGPGDEPVEGWGEDAVKHPEHNAVIGYFPDNVRVDKRCRDLENALSSLKKANNITWRTVYKIIDEKDWATSWKAFFHSEKITDNIVVKPTWREYVPQEDEIILEIDPGMAFGTGTHPTTAMCVEMLEKHISKGDCFLDVGTGSGILMIAAEKLGAETIWGIDTDEVAVEVAEKNLQVNRIDPAKYKLMTGNLADMVNSCFNCITANILSEVIIQLLDTMKNLLEDNGILICSGIIETNKNIVFEKMNSRSLEVVDVLTKEGWVAIAAKRKEL